MNDKSGIGMLGGLALLAINLPEVSSALVKVCAQANKDEMRVLENVFSAVTGQQGKSEASNGVGNLPKDTEPAVKGGWYK